MIMLMIMASSNPPRPETFVVEEEHHKTSAVVVVVDVDGHSSLDTCSRFVTRTLRSNPNAFRCESTMRGLQYGEYRQDHCLFSTHMVESCYLTFLHRVRSQTFELKEASAPRASKTWRVSGL